MTSTIPLADCHHRPLAQVGGKAAALGRLIANGAPVPPGFVVPPEVQLGEAVWAAFSGLGAEFVAVRSSAAGEDAKGQSWAGQFESYLYVTRDQLLDRIRDCRRSGESSRAQAYDQSGQGMPVAVVVQAMINSDVAGVLFTANPVTGSLDEIVVEAVYGLGELLVQGLATPDNFVLAKPSGGVKKQTLASKTTMLVGSAEGLAERAVPKSRRDQAALSQTQCRELVALAIRLEHAFGHPLDIEFAYERNHLYIVQARPITTI